MRQVNAIVLIEWNITNKCPCLIIVSVTQFAPVRKIVEDSWSRMAETFAIV